MANLHGEMQERLLPNEIDDTNCCSGIVNCMLICWGLCKSKIIPSCDVLTASILTQIWATTLTIIFIGFTIADGIRQIDDQEGKENIILAHVNLKIILIGLMGISIIGIFYCICKRSDRNMVRCNKSSSSTNFSIHYLLVGLYVFGIGTLLLCTIWLLYSVQMTIDRPVVINNRAMTKIDVLYSGTRLVFVVLQIAFSQSFWNATFNNKWYVKFLLFHTIAVNICIWLMNVSDETHLFESEMKKIQPANSTIDLIEKFVDTFDDYLTPFTLEYSLIVAGILYGIIGNMKAFSQINDNEDNNINGDDGDDIVDNVMNDRAQQPRMQPGMLFGIISAIILVICEIMLALVENTDAYPIYLKIYYIYFFLLCCIMVFSCIRMLSVVSKFFTKHENTSARPDDILLFFSLFWGILFDVLVFLGTINCTIVDKEMVSFMLVSELVQFIQRLVQTCTLYQCHKYETNMDQDNQIAPAKVLRQNSLFLLFTNLGFWILDAFFEMKNFGSYSYPCGPRAFGIDIWNKLFTFIYPIVTFYRFHTAAMSFDLWFHFRFHRRRRERNDHP
eukprot:gene3782-4305_t